MIRIAIKEKDIIPTLERCGYVPHPKGNHHGYIKQRSEGERWHAYWFQNDLEIHLDITIHGKHKVAKLFGQLEEEHKQEVLAAKKVIRDKRMEEAQIKHLGKKKAERLKYGAVLPKEKLREALDAIKKTT